MQVDIKIDKLNGYRFRGTPADDKRLERAGAKRLTTIKDIADLDSNPETLLEKLLHESYPDGYNDSGDRYFIIEKDGVQYLVLEHGGQWFVGNKAATVKTGELETLLWPKKEFCRNVEANRRFIRATIAILKEKCRGDKSVVFDPSEYEFKDDIPYCREFAAPVDTVWWSENLAEGEIGITVDIDGFIFSESFNGVEDEDFDHLFHAVYDELYDQRHDTVEADEWLERNFPKEK